MTVIPKAAEVTIGKNGNKHKLKDCWITNETKALVEKRDKQGQAPFKGKRYVPEKEYIHMISSYITADWSNIE